MVDEDWEIRWETQGESFQIAVSQDGSSRTVFTHDGPASGSTIPRGSGTFELIISAEGPWSIQVIQP
jgi:hypothetical protein